MDDTGASYLCHHTSKACQGVTTTGCPSSPVDFIVIKERERVGAIGHQHGLEGVHLQNVQNKLRSSSPVVAPLPPQPLCTPPTLHPTPKHRRPALMLCHPLKFVLASSAKKQDV